MSEPIAHHHIEIVEPGPDSCQCEPLAPEGNVKFKNYRLVNDNLRAYTPTGDIHTSPTKGKLMPRFDVCSNISPPRDRILELLRPDDRGRDALEAIVRPAPRRGLTRPLDEDTRRFLQRALLSPSPQGFSGPNTPEPHGLCASPVPPQTQPAPQRHSDNNAERSLADELREAEEEERGVTGSRHLEEEERWCSSSVEAAQRHALGRLALETESEEYGEEALGLAARRLDALLAESRALHAELAGIQQDIQTWSYRATQCRVTTRALIEESLAVRYLDDVVALLRGDVAKAKMARAWPFALGVRDPDRNYVI